MEFVDLKYQYQLYKDEIQQELSSVMENASFINGPALKQFETELSDYLGSGIEAIGCSSGTDALLIALMALGVEQGDEVIIPDFTFIATGEVLMFLGAVPVFCDVDPDFYNMDPSKLTQLITERTVGIIPVSLFGQTADFDAINKVADDYGLWVMEDGAQSFGASYKGRKSCTLTRVSTTSFFPAKPLGGYGDGGAMFTFDSELAKKIRIILNHGQVKRYHHSVVGMNGRMDSLQAAILSVKLRHFEAELAARQSVATKYSDLLEGIVHTPKIAEYNTSTWAQYTVQHDDRERIRGELKNAGIPTAVHYPVPLHKQGAFDNLYAANSISTPVTERISERVFSLPMHPFLKDAEIEHVALTLRGMKL